MRVTKHMAALRRRAMPLLLANGFTRADAAHLLGIAYSSTSNYCRTPVVRNTERELAMCEAYKRGETLEQIGAAYDLTRERVRQLLARHNISAKHGGAHFNSELRRRQAAAKRDAKSMQKHGCTWAEYQSLLALQRMDGRKNAGPIRAFDAQRKNAQVRAIPWNLKIWEWWSIWQESGKWELRGRGKGHYCMARLGDQGAYERSNVKIISNEENISESYIHTPAHKRLGIVRDELGLTTTQRRIYDIAIHGFGPKAIADQLGLNRGTVSTSLVVIRRLVPSMRPAA